MSVLTFFAHAKYRRLLLTGFSAFILVGAVQAMYGPSFASFQERFGLSTSTVGLLVSLHFIGSLISILSSGFVVLKLGYRTTLSFAIALMALGSLGLALSPTWLLSLGATFFIGLGFGFIDAGMNMLFARSFEEQSAPALNLLNAMFGVGAVLGPLLVALFLPRVPLAFLSYTVIAVIVFFFALGLPNPETRITENTSVQIPWGKFIGFLLIFFFYVMSEIGAASWEATHLAPYYGEARGALYTSLYWAALTVGRFVATPISSFVKAPTLVLLSTFLALIGALAAHNVALAPFAYMFIGFAFAPFFPTGLAWLGQVFPKRIEQLTPIVMATANIGAVISSPVIGWLIDRSSSDAVPTIMSGAAIILLSITTLLWLRTRT
ncbi:MAG: MFS transporter [Trueperaceae bacterium]|nr:MFS transporter [Trueperaceae bacterium]